MRGAMRGVQGRVGQVKTAAKRGKPKGHAASKADRVAPPTRESGWMAFFKEALADVS